MFRRFDWLSTIPNSSRSSSWPPPSSSCPGRCTPWLQSALSTSCRAAIGCSSASPRCPWQQRYCSCNASPRPPPVSSRYTQHYTTLHNATQRYTTLHNTMQHYTPLHYTTLHYTTLCNTTLHYTTLHYTTLHNTMQHYTTLHYTTLHYTMQHYTTLHNTTLHSDFHFHVTNR